MSEPKRLIDEASGDELETSLLRLAQHERPSPESRQRILAGIAAASVVATSAERVQGSQAAAEGLSAAVKWGALGLLALAIPAALFFGSRESEPARLAPTALEATPAVPKPNQELVPVPGAPEAAPLAVNDLPTLTTAAAVSGAASSAKSKGSLAEEVAQLQKAKLLLKSGNAAQAMRELDSYAQRFPRPLLGSEALVVRIEALHAAGNTARAKSLVETFLSKNPDSPYASRLKNLTGAR